MKRNTLNFLSVRFVIVLATTMALCGAVQAQMTPAQLRAMAKGHTDSLKTIPTPDSANFNLIVQNRGVLLLLGKALFWDQQLGSDGQSCASCHFHAGADNRSKNQLNPGFRNTTIPGGDMAFSAGHWTNKTLTPVDLPFHNVIAGTDSNDIVSSQGVFNSQFVGLSGNGRDLGTPSLTGPGAVFNVDDGNGHRVLVRNVEPRNTPTVINSAFNHRNFWDGRARFEFNGNNPFGNLDPTARTVKGCGICAKPALVKFSDTRLSTGSQADGPPLSNLEMSFAGRRFPEVGRKMFGLTPLGQQLVDPTDSVYGITGPLGMVSNIPSPGISQAYSNLVQQAFLPIYWNVPGWVVDISSGSPVLVKSIVTGPNRFSVMEYNFPLYFGYAVAEYEKSLRSDQTRFDTFMEGDDTVLSASEQNGLHVFLTNGKCIACHSGPELTNASITNVQKLQTLERMIMGDDKVAVYDNGFYNTGVRPTLEDIGVGGTAPSGAPLSNTRLNQQCLQSAMNANPLLTLAQANKLCTVPRILARMPEAEILLSKAAALLPSGDPVRTSAEALIAQARVLTIPKSILCKLAKNPASFCPSTNGAYDVLAAYPSPPAGFPELLAAAVSLLPDQVSPGSGTAFLAPFLQPNERAAVDGAFKAPGLRNLELTAPFFHNGGTNTLDDVVEFYDRGGDFALANIDNLDPNIQPLFLTVQEKADLVAFLKALTDWRVKNESAPFDHPSLTVGNGGTPGVSPTLYIDGSLGCDPSIDVCLLDDQINVPAVGAAGNAWPLLGTPYTVVADFPDPLQ